MDCFFVYCTVAGCSSGGLRDSRWWRSCTAGSVMCPALPGPPLPLLLPNSSPFLPRDGKCSALLWHLFRLVCVPRNPLSYCFSLLTSRPVSWAVAANGGKMVHRSGSLSLNITSRRCDPRADGGGDMRVPVGSPMKVMLSGAVYQPEGKCSHVYNLYFIN